MKDKMKKSLLLLLLLAFFLATAAAQNLDIAELKNITTFHDATASGSFSLLNNNSEFNATNINCSISISNFNTTCSLVSELQNKSNATTTFTIAVPKYSLGTYNGILNVNYALNNTASTTSASFILEVNRTASLQILWTKKPSDLYASQEMLAELNITNNGNIFLDVNTNISGFLTRSYAFSLLPGASQNISLNITTTNATSITKHNIIVNASGINSSDSFSALSEEKFSVKYAYCNVVDSSKISLEIENENDIKEKRFKPLDTIVIEPRITNKDSITTYTTVKAVLFSSSVLSETELSEKIKLEAGESRKIRLEMKMPSDANEGSYYVYVKAYDGTCYQKDVLFFIEREGYSLTPIDVSIEPTTVKCGSSFVLKSRIANIGDYDEKKIKIEYKDEIGFSQSKILNDLYKGEKSALFSFSFNVPTNASAGSKRITLFINHNYDDMTAEFKSREEHYYYIVLEDCYEEKKGYSIETQPFGYLGKTFNVVFFVKNEGNVKSEYEIDAETDWAYIESIDPKKFSLEAGKEETVVIKLTPRKDTHEGDYVLYADITQDGKNERKEIIINLQKMSSSVYSEISTKIKENLLWVFVDLVLIAIIIYVVSSIIKKRSY